VHKLLKRCLCVVVCVDLAISVKRSEWQEVNLEIDYILFSFQFCFVGELTTFVSLCGLKMTNDFYSKVCYYSYIDDTSPKKKRPFNI